MKMWAASAVGLLVCCANLNAGEQAAVEASAKQWAEKMGLKPRGSTCTAHDSDLDGFVSCSVADESGQVHSLECSWTWGGCRMAERLKVRR